QTPRRERILATSAGDAVAISGLDTTAFQRPGDEGSISRKKMPTTNGTTVSSVAPMTPNMVYPRDIGSLSKQGVQGLLRPHTRHELEAQEIPTRAAVRLKAIHVVAERAEFSPPLRRWRRWRTAHSRIPLSDDIM